MDIAYNIIQGIIVYYEFAQFLFPIGPKSGLYDFAREYLKVNKVDAIIATGDPFVLFSYASKLSKEFDYFGKIEVVSNNKGIVLDGSTRLNHACKYDRSWMKFRDTIEAKNVQIH